MKFKNPLQLSILLASDFVLSQTITISDCIGPLTAAPNCDFYISKLSACNSLVGSAAGNCYCPQTVLNAIAGCEGEFRLCAAGYEYDSEFEGPNGFFGLWHSACDGFITYSPTTPAIATLSQTADAGACQTAEQECALFGASTDSCSSSYTEAQAYSSCVCQATILDLVSRCEVDGSVSCLLQTPITTDLWSYMNCRGSGMNAQTTSSISEMSSRVMVTTEATVVSTPAASGTASSLGPTATSTGFAEQQLQVNQVLLVACWLAAVMQLL